MVRQYFLVTCILLLSAIGLAQDLGRRRTKRFTLELTWEKGNPDGGPERNMIFMNGEFPGPTLDITQGDDVEVVVKNKMPFNTGIHFHGIEQLGTPWSDGVPGVTQRPIRAGKEFKYKWKATQYGSYFYHSHTQDQIEDGMYGAIVIRPDNTVTKPFSKITTDRAALKAIETAEKNVVPLLLSDWRHVDSFETWKIQTDTNIETACVGSILFNGKGSVDCWEQDKINALTRPEQLAILEPENATMTARGEVCLPPIVLAGIVVNATLPPYPEKMPPAIFEVCESTSGSKEVIKATGKANGAKSWIAIDVIGAFGLHTGLFSIDEHPMWVYAADGLYIEPTRVEAFEITNGDRYSILVELDKPIDDYNIRFSSNTGAQLISGNAILSYGADNTDDISEPFILDNSLDATATAVTRLNVLDTAPFSPVPFPTTVDATFKLYMTTMGAIYLWAVNGTRYPRNRDEREPPILFDPQPYLQDNITISTTKDSVVDLIFISEAGRPPHPMHKHGNKVWFLGRGMEDFPYDTVDEAVAGLPPGSLNLVNPPRRDGFGSLPSGPTPVWMVVRYQATDPGPWLLHCHIQSHLAGGMSMLIQDGVDAWPTVPKEYLDYH
ncbi:hypothetical protein P152DRAFT_396454 [Eremomyces bilateralis CBS 781.70]|uniref:Multicopper oxidase n=1 Tax=Eremomyces bilateralis CBS 781.70 TaxID=1392243 RepID=A0A6G1G4Q5_9PEZI|nr:uncharacterized protein P152DRAFT_396454 [Eremomyces bilateralis CBS 781.70]KAF1812998.1 hypothetical protein P152DRAFT_396454 [Eremomyces bilateralis CBS 781.70]